MRIKRVHWWKYLVSINFLNSLQLVLQLTVHMKIHANETTLARGRIIRDTMQSKDQVIAFLISQNRLCKSAFVRVSFISHISKLTNKYKMWIVPNHVGQRICKTSSMNVKFLSTYSYQSIRICLCTYLYAACELYY